MNIPEDLIQAQEICHMVMRNLSTEEQNVGEMEVRIGDELQIIVYEDKTPKRLFSLPLYRMRDEKRLHAPFWELVLVELQRFAVSAVLAYEECFLREQELQERESMQDFSVHSKAERILYTVKKLGGTGWAFPDGEEYVRVVYRTGNWLSARGKNPESLSHLWNTTRRECLRLAEQMAAGMPEEKLKQWEEIMRGGIEDDGI